MRVRHPAVSGSFYPAGRDDLTGMIEESYLHRLGPGSLPAGGTGPLAVICPHAGYVYSGPLACRSIHAISGGAYDTFVIIGPDHRGRGRPLATVTDCAWKTPLGMVEVDTKLASELAGSSRVEIDFDSHIGEHSIEMQVPILQYTFTNFRILPVSMADQSMEAAVHLGRAVASLARGRRIMILGSSDLTHYEPDGTAREQDCALLEHVLNLDVGSFYDTLVERRVSACGYGAIAAVMVASQELGAAGGSLLGYATSGDTSGDRGSVVGYPSVVFS